MSRDLFATIDPGLGGTGIALWNDKQLAPIVADVISPGKEGDDLYRTEEVSDEFYQFFAQYKDRVHTVHIEWPQLHTTAQGFASAQNGSIFKLTVLVGTLARTCWDLGMKVQKLEINDWKGNMNKDVVASRVAARLGCKPTDYPNHTMDAVGMGLYLKGKLNGTGTRRIRKV